MPALQELSTHRHKASGRHEAVWLEITNTRASCWYAMTLQDTSPGPLVAPSPLKVDEGLPSLAGLKNPLCHHGCNMACASAASHKRHDTCMLFHFQDQQINAAKRKRTSATDTNSEPAANKQWKNGYEECTFTAASQYQLRSHKEQEGHKLARGRPSGQKQ